MGSQRIRATEHACLHMPWDGLCTLGGVVGSSCQVAEAPLCHPRPRGTRLLWAPSSLTPRAPSRQHPTLWVWPSLGSGQALPRIPEPWAVSEDSQGQPGQPHQRQVEAVPSYPGSCVGGPDCFLITLCFRQDKILSLKKHVCGVGVHPEKVRPPGNREQSVRLQNSFASQGLHVRPRGPSGTHSGGANAFKWSGWFWKKMCRFAANISSFLPGT